MAVTLNVIISGVSASGDLDTTSQPLRVEMGNSDKIGMATFVLQNRDSKYQAQTTSGNATCQIDAIQNGSVTTVFRGTVETLEPEIKLNGGQIASVTAYDFGQELLGVVSPDARLPSILSASGTINILSGDQGIGTLDGMDLASFVSGTNSSGALLSNFLNQFYGHSGDSSGSFSGAMFSFKPAISGYTWKTYYLPDAVGFVGANDNNANYLIPFNTHKVKREYAWNALRKLLRQNIVIDSTGARVPLESYIDVSGGIHVFTSGSYEFLASGALGLVTLQYYTAGQSGSALNNIIEGKLPNDTANVKNYIVGWFPAQGAYPLDLDIWSDFFAYSGGYWSGISENPASTVTISGTNPGSSIGAMSVMGTANYGATPRVSGQFALEFSMFSGQTINILQWAISGGGGVNLNYLYKWSGNNGFAGGLNAMKSVMLTDLSGNYIIKSGATGGPVPIGANALDVNATGNWVQLSDVIYKGLPPLTNNTGSGLVGNVFNSGTGNDGGWAASATFPDLSNIKKIRIGMGYGLTAPASGFSTSLWIDNLFFSFTYQFSPVVVFNSGSQGMGYGRRYAIVEFPESNTLSGATALVTNELNTRMGSKQLGLLTIKDNPLGTPAQLNIKPGQVFGIDAPSLNTGSGRTFFYWRAISVVHEYGHKVGFITKLRVIPWYSGSITAPNSNTIDYHLPMSTGPPPPSRNDYMPTHYPFRQPTNIRA